MDPFGDVYVSSNQNMQINIPMYPYIIITADDSDGQTIKLPALPNRGDTIMVGRAFYTVQRIAFYANSVDVKLILERHS